MECTKCGYHVPDGETFSFCPKCGSKIEEEIQAPPAEVPPTSAPDPSVPAPSPNEVILPQMKQLGQEIGVQEDSGKKKILIVEDDLFIRELYQKQLQIAGYDVDVSVDGMEGREKIKAKHYDMLLLDIMLPRMNGLDLLKLIKDDEQTKYLPVIILSNLGQDSVIEKGLALGAINYIVKADVTPMEMLKIIEEKIGK